MKRILIAGAIVALLAGCGTRPPKIIKQRVEVPVVLPCVDRADIPAERIKETDSLQKGDSIFMKTKAALIDLKGLEADEKVMRALLEGCVQQEAE